jgi:hypothetical protein
MASDSINDANGKPVALYIRSGKITAQRYTKKAAARKTISSAGRMIGIYTDKFDVRDLRADLQELYRDAA